MKKILLLAIFVCLTAPEVWAASQVVFLFNDYPPHTFMMEGRPAGTDIEVVQEASRRIGVEAVFQVHPWKAAVKRIKEGTADAIVGIHMTPDRQRFLFISEEFISPCRDAIVALEGKDIRINDLSDLIGMSIGVVSAYSYGPEFDSMTYLERDPAEGEEMLLKKLVAGRTDLAIINRSVMDYIAQKLGIRNRIQVLHVLPNNPLYLAFSRAKGEPARKLAEDYSRVIARLRGEGFMNAVAKKYFIRNP